MTIKVTFYEFGTNRPIGEHILNADAMPRVGEYMILDSEIRENYQENMYVVRGVTTLLPKPNCFAGDKCVHIEKFNPDEEHKKVQELEKKLKDIMNQRG